MVAAEATLQTPTLQTAWSVSPQTGKQPPTAHRVWVGVSQPHTVVMCVQASSVPTTANRRPLVALQVR